MIAIAPSSSRDVAAPMRKRWIRSCCLIDAALSPSTILPYGSVTRSNLQFVFARAHRIVMSQRGLSSCGSPDAALSGRPIFPKGAKERANRSLSFDPAHRVVIGLRDGRKIAAPAGNRGMRSCGLIDAVRSGSIAWPNGKAAAHNRKDRLGLRIRH